MTQEIDQIQDDEIVLTVTDDDHNRFKRLDHFLSHSLPNLSRSTIKSLHANEHISLHEDSPFQGKCELKKLPPVGSLIEINIPPPLPSHLVAQNIPLEILFEDEHLVIIVKPAGMVTHPAPGNPDGTLVNAILFHCPDLTGIGDSKRPGIVHRLDKGTSGVMVVAKSHTCHEKLVQLFSAHDLTRQYQALAIGHLPQETGRLESTIGRHPQNRKKMAANVRGKKAITYYEKIEKFNNVVHIQCTLETGRTHQIRVHLSQLLNCPILMDEMYGDPKRHLRHLPEATRQILADYPYPLLHAKVLNFVHPITQQQMNFAAEPPIIFQQVLESLKVEK
jgi:23S rRNA pseudouridine1911/1915/1917 synthase